MKCFYCMKSIDEEEDKNNIWNIAIETPYANLIIHKEPCLRAIQGKENEYLTENIDRIYDYIDGNFKKSTKRK